MDAEKPQVQHAQSPAEAPQPAGNPFDRPEPQDTQCTSENPFDRPEGQDPQCALTRGSEPRAATGVQTTYSARAQSLRQMRAQQEALNKMAPSKVPQPVTRFPTVSAPEEAMRSTNNTKPHPTGPPSMPPGRRTQMRTAVNFHPNQGADSSTDRSIWWWPQQVLFAFSCCTSRGARDGLK